MHIEIIDFYYFSGTGNTLLVIKAMEEVFVGSGVVVNYYPIESSKPEDIDLEHTIGLAFPVALQGTFSFIWDFINDMPTTQETSVFMMDTLMAFSGGIVGPVRNILKRKGYKTIGAKEIIMPSNYSSKKISEEKKNRIITKASALAEEFAKDIVSGESNWGYIPMISNLMSIISRSSKIWNLMSNIFSLKVTESKCTKCELCVKLCPINAIIMDEYPVIGDSCRLCMRCISFCPTNAINPKKIKIIPYKSISLKNIYKQRVNNKI